MRKRENWKRRFASVPPDYEVFLVGETGVVNPLLSTASLRSSYSSLSAATIVWNKANGGREKERIKELKPDEVRPIENIRRVSIIICIDSYRLFLFDILMPQEGLESFYSGPVPPTAPV